LNKLESLISPVSHVDFFKSYMSSESYVTHNLSESISELMSIDFLSSLDDLLSKWPFEVSVHLPELSDEASSISVQSADAFPYFNKKMSLLFNDVNRISPILESWTKQLRKDLGLSALTYGRNLVYATPKGGGTAAHFDQNINFVLQLQGTKEWWVAKNTDIKNPLTRHTMGTEPDPELASYLERPLSESFPENFEHYTLGPGSLLFVPRGSWHKTKSQTDSLALNFTFSPPSYLDLLTTAMRGRLAGDERWRATADFVSDPERCLEALGTFDDLLQELSQEIPHWKASHILSATEIEE
jgi:50S ribosomal protein L16 3-hydroxylase